MCMTLTRDLDAYTLVETNKTNETNKSLLAFRTMYWADWNREAPKIEVASMDGGRRRVLVQRKMGLPNGLTLDRRNDELCWTDAMYHSISCVNLGSGRSEVVYSAARLV